MPQHKAHHHHIPHSNNNNGFDGNRMNKIVSMKSSYDSQGTLVSLIPNSMSTGNLPPYAAIDITSHTHPNDNGRSKRFQQAFDLRLGSHPVERSNSYSSLDSSDTTPCGTPTLDPASSPHFLAPVPKAESPAHTAQLQGGHFVLVRNESSLYTTHAPYGTLLPRTVLLNRPPETTLSNTAMLNGTLNTPKPKSPSLVTVYCQPQSMDTEAIVPDALLKNSCCYNSLMNTPPLTPSSSSMSLPTVKPSASLEEIDASDLKTSWGDIMDQEDAKMEKAMKEKTANRVPKSLSLSSLTIGLWEPRFYCIVEFKRGRQCTYESPNYIAPWECVVVQGDRGEDIGEVVSCFVTTTQHSWFPATPCSDGTHVTNWAANTPTSASSSSASLLPRSASGKLTVDKDHKADSHSNNGSETNTEGCETSRSAAVSVSTSSSTMGTAELSSTGDEEEAVTPGRRTGAGNDSYNSDPDKEEERIHEIPVPQVLRKATPEEAHAFRYKQRHDERLCVELCNHKVVEHGLDMRVVDAEFQFDRKKLTFFYDAQERQDFRTLCRDLYREYRTRIWFTYAGDHSLHKTRLGGGVMPNNDYDHNVGKLSNGLVSSGSNGSLSAIVGNGPHNGNSSFGMQMQNPVAARGYTATRGGVGYGNVNRPRDQGVVQRNTDNDRNRKDRKARYSGQRSDR